MENYQKLLDEAYSKIKKESSSYSDRFEIPKAIGRIEGNKTIITNFNQIVSYLRRSQDHLLKFLTKELASYSQVEGERLIINNKISSQKINDKIELEILNYHQI
jgi:translation initiation factor 2 subunit 2